MNLSRFHISVSNVSWPKISVNLSVRKMSVESSQHELKSIFSSAVLAVEPRQLIRNSVRLTGRHLSVAGNSYHLKKPCFLVAFGKAVLGMTIELESILGPHLQRGIAVVPTGIFDCLKEKTVYQPPHNSKITYIEGARNNLPDNDAMRGAEQIKKLAESLDLNDLLIVLISGGGSALLPLPKDYISLNEKMDVIRKLAASGGDIVELNTVRKSLSKLKGGGLANLAYPARVVSLILSDVIGDPLDIIASGPTVLSSNTLNNSTEILEKYSLLNQIPDSVKTVLNQSAGNTNMLSSAIDVHVDNILIGNNEMAVKAALDQSSKIGYDSVLLSTAVKGDVSRLSKFYAELAAFLSNPLTERNSLKTYLEAFKDELSVSDAVIDDIINLLPFNSNRGLCLVAGGEPTVVVRGKGRGGRNQQLALAFSVELHKINVKSADIAFLSCGTDGIDGPTDAAGAIGTSNLVNKSLAENINPVDYLDNNDSYGFYSKFDNGSHIIRVGHTGTNVMDIHVLLINPK